MLQTNKKFKIVTWLGKKNGNKNNSNTVPPLSVAAFKVIGVSY